MGPPQWLRDLCEQVDAAFEQTAAGLRRWADPHPDRSPSEEEYSRLTDPRKWRIVNARLDAWIEVVTAAGVATVARDTPVSWVAPDTPAVGLPVDVVTPRVPDGLDLVAARSRIGGVDDAGVTLGVRLGPGDDAVTIGLFPDCGCDACDSGSDVEIEVFDEHIVAVVSGAFRMLRRGRQEISTLGGGGRRARNVTRRGEVDRALADPAGWDEYLGPSWHPVANPDKPPAGPLA